MHCVVIRGFSIGDSCFESLPPFLVTAAPNNSFFLLSSEIAVCNPMGLALRSNTGTYRIPSLPRCQTRRPSLKTPFVFFSFQFYLNFT